MGMATIIGRTDEWNECSESNLSWLDFTFIKDYLCQYYAILETLLFAIHVYFQHKMSDFVIDSGCHIKVLLDVNKTGLLKA